MVGCYILKIMWYSPCFATTYQKYASFHINILLYVSVGSTVYLHFSLFHYLPTFQYVPQPTYISVCSTTYLHFSMNHYLPTFQFVPLPTYISVCSTTYLHFSMFHYLPTFQYVPLPTKFQYVPLPTYVSIRFAFNRAIPLFQCTFCHLPYLPTYK